MREPTESGGGPTAVVQRAPAPGVSEADLIGLVAIGGQFGTAGLQAAGAAVGLATGPLQAPGMHLALVMAGPEGVAAFARMQLLAYLRLGDSLGGAALGLCDDATELVLAAMRFALADPGFFTAPLTTVPLDVAERDPEGAEVMRRVTFELEADLTASGINGGTAGTVVVEYLRNGMVRVSLEGMLQGGVEAAATGVGGVRAVSGPLVGATWVMADGREAARLLARLGIEGVRMAGGPALGVGALALSGALPPIPAPQTVTVGGAATAHGRLDLGRGRFGLEGSADLKGEVTVDENGDRTVEIGIEGEAGTSLAGALTAELPPAARAQLPGGGSDIVEAGAEARLEVKAGPDNRVESVSVSVTGLSAEGAELSGPGAVGEAASAQSASGHKAEVKLTLGREQLEALGADGRRLLDALGRNQPVLVAVAVAEMADVFVEQGKVEIERHRYTTVGVQGGAERGLAGLSGGGEVTIESRQR